MATITSTNPYTGETNATFETLSDADLQLKLNQAHHAYQQRKHTSSEQKKALFLRLADLLEADLDEHAKLQTIEMGVLLSASIAGMKGTVSLIRRFAEHAETYLKDENVTDEGLQGYMQYDPIGVIYGIAPWNFPYHQLLRAAVPNILAGNTVVYKHASNVPLCAQAIEHLFLSAGFPEGVYTNIFISTNQSEQILAHPAVQGVNLTGGEAAGRAIGSLAGTYLKRSILELGGNDAFVLLDHNDIDKMVAAAVTCRISNGGQRCNASKRFIILEKHYDAFVEKMGAHMATLIVGDPEDPDTQLPPLATSKLLHEVHSQVEKTISEGARLITGGTIIDKTRNLYAGTVLADVVPGMTSYEEEVFGPVASIIKAKDIDDAISIANNNPFGLSAVVYGDDLDQCKQVAARLEGGMVFINQPAGSKASLPFGGVKKSGYGKENGPEGLRAFTNKKVIIW